MLLDLAVRPAEQRVDEMRRFEWHSELRPGDDGRVQLTAVGVAAVVTGEPQIAELCARFEKAGLLERPARASRWTLRNHGQGQRFAEGHAVGRFAEVDAARRTDPLDVASEGREIEVGFQQIALGISCLQPHRRGGLTQFARRTFCVFCR